MQADPKDDFKHRDEHLFNLNEIFQFWVITQIYFFFSLFFFQSNNSSSFPKPKNMNDKFTKISTYNLKFLLIILLILFT
jgi:hypothetical protein